jgi:uroporphyrinogen-III synthase
MSTGGLLWLVGTEARVEAQRAEWTSPRFVPHALAWARLVPRMPEAQVLAAIKYHRPGLVLLTSAAAVSMLAPGSVTGEPAACVGEGTAEAARRAGFHVALTGGAGSVALADAVLASRPRPRRLLWLRAEEATLAGAERLRMEGLEVAEVVAYAAEPLPGFGTAVRAAPEPGAVLVESPRGATALAGALLAADRTLPRACGLYALGQSAAARLRELGFGGAISVAPWDLRSWFAGLR